MSTSSDELTHKLEWIKQYREQHPDQSAEQVKTAYAAAHGTETTEPVQTAPAAEPVAETTVASESPFRSGTKSEWIFNYLKDHPMASTKDVSKAYADSHNGEELPAASVYQVKAKVAAGKETPKRDTTAAPKSSNTTSDQLWAAKQLLRQYDGATEAVTALKQAAEFLGKFATVNEAVEAVELLEQLLAD